MVLGDVRSMQSNAQVPWFWMFCNGTLELKATVAPECPRECNITDWLCKFNLCNMREKCLQSLVSEGNQLFFIFYSEKGLVGTLRSICTATMGQRGKTPKEGIFSNWTVVHLKDF